MSDIDRNIARAAGSDEAVLLTGEAGAGKAEAAGRIHRGGPRAAEPMVRLTCEGVPDVILESDLFGHLPGSFDGAFRAKPGLLDVAPNGTLFLAEVSGLSPHMQDVLCRFLESGECRRVGTLRVHRRADVRIVASSRVDLRARVGQGTFREDLWERLSVTLVAVPPLRERAEDIPALVSAFLRRAGTTTPTPRVSDEAMAALVSHHWPGNVRQLRAVVERIAWPDAGAMVGLDDLPADVSMSSAALADAPAAARA